MRNLVVLICLVLTFTSCKKEEAQRIEGEFLYIADAAVLKGDNFIYGVKLDEMATKLQNQAKGYKKDEFDMVPVIIEGIIEPKKEGTEGWDEVVTVKKILAVMHPKEVNESESLKIERKKEDKYKIVPPAVSEE
tara:strand:+ start:545 stop:946 length:402 start_codon:yes stop_codon:yes gene_type:complete